MTDQVIAEVPSLCAIFQERVRVDADVVALRASDATDGLTWREYGDRVRRIAAGLAALGVGHGDTVALMLTNRPEFHLLDAAAMHLGAIPFSIYNISTADQIRYLFASAGNTLVVTEDQFVPVLTAATAGTAVDRIICVDGDHPDLMDLAELEAGGDPAFDFEAAWRAVTRDDVATLIYTSGTTGPPKGVETTHGNLLSSIASLVAVDELAPMLKDARVISYLPDAHLANRWFAHYMPMVMGGTVVTLRELRTIPQALVEVRPTLFLGAPQLWYKLVASIEQAIAGEHGLRSRIARWALATGLAHVRAAQSGTVSPLLRAQHAIADRLVLAKLRARIGLDACTLPISSTAPVAKETLELVLSLGIPLCEAWGMTETTVLGTLNRPSGIRPGTVGQAFPGIDIRLAEDGEVLLRSGGVMKGYRNDPAKTADAVDVDGWLHTGDIGAIDPDGYLTIVDRKKEIIINASGKNMSPANIEGALRSASPLLGPSVAVGDDRPHVAALITLDPDGAATLASRLGVPGDDVDALVAHPEVRSLVEQAVATANTKLSRVEQIKDYALLPTYWLPGGDELTPTMKLKRRPIADKYADEIAALYATNAKA